MDRFYVYPMISDAEKKQLEIKTHANYALAKMAYVAALVLAVVLPILGGF